MTSVVVYTSNIDIEIGFGVLVRFAYAKLGITVEHRIKKLSEMASSFREPVGYDTLIIFGTFWDHVIDTVKENNSNVQIYRIETRSPVFEFLSSQTFGELGISNDFFTLFNERLCGIQTELNQSFVTGIINYQPTISSSEKFLMLFNGEVTMEQICEIGSSIINEQEDIVRNRVNNSKSSFFKDGVKYAITNSTDLYGLAHDELKRAYPDTQVTVIFSLEFDKYDTLGTRFRFSMKSWDENVDVSQIMKSNLGDQNAGGDRKMSGGGIFKPFVLIPDEVNSVSGKIYNIPDETSESVKTLCCNRVEKLSCQTTFRSYVNSTEFDEVSRFYLSKKYQNRAPVLLKVLFEDQIKISAKLPFYEYVGLFPELDEILNGF